MVQVKKAEMRQTIIDVATDEFMKKGYENASLRVIAQKSHTTLGNIYHYFKNKEILLETIVLPVLDNIDDLMDEHIQNYKANVLSKEELLYYTEHLHGQRHGGFESRRKTNWHEKLMLNDGFFSFAVARQEPLLSKSILHCYR